jgi:hypothetical protein
MDTVSIEEFPGWEELILLKKYEMVGRINRGATSGGRLAFGDADGLTSRYCTGFGRQRAAHVDGLGPITKSSLPPASIWA